jgi:hypothetical protein
MEMSVEMGLEEVLVTLCRTFILFVFVRCATFRKASAGIKAIKLAAKPSYVSTRSRDSDKSEYTATPHNLRP